MLDPDHFDFFRDFAKFTTKNYSANMPQIYSGPVQVVVLVLKFAAAMASTPSLLTK